MKKKAHNAKRGAWLARRGRVARSLLSTDRPRLTVFRSAKHIYAQIVDLEGRTVASASTRAAGVVGEGGTGNVAAAKSVGRAIAALAKDRNIEAVVFNRNGFLYHGRVKALAEAARESGLKF